MIKNIFYIFIVLFLIIYCILPNDVLLNNLVKNQTKENNSNTKIKKDNLTDDNNPNNNKYSIIKKTKSNKRQKIKWRNYKSISLLDIFKNKFGNPNSINNNENGEAIWNFIDNNNLSSMFSFINIKDTPYDSNILTIYTYLTIDNEQISQITQLASNISYKFNNSQLVITCDSYEKILVLLNIIYYVITNRISIDDIKKDNMISIGINNLFSQPEQIQNIENEIMQLRHEYKSKINSLVNSNKTNITNSIVEFSNKESVKNITETKTNNIEKTEDIEIDLAIDDENIDYKKTKIHDFDKDWKGNNGVMTDNDFFYIV